MQHSGLAGRPLECLLSMRRGKTLTTRVCSRRGIAFALALAALMAASPSALADQGGISFWLPGLFGSLAAVPGQPGVSFTTIYIHPAVEAGGQKNFNLGGQIVAGVDGHANLVAFGPTYVFATPVLGGQAAISLFGVGGRDVASISATLTGPLGRTISGSRTDGLTSFGDLLPQGSLKWNQGVHNFMIYAMGDIPVGDYDPTRLANLGLGHGAIDGGGGYTYFNPQTGNELSTVAGFTYNFENTALQYQNGVDLHVDWAASHFLTKQILVGAVGYYFQQITGDSGAGATLGGFRSRVAGIGPQIGYLFPVGEQLQGYVNVKAYKEFAAENRPEGWNLWVTLSFSPAAPIQTPMLRK
jgi:hypothetical protein